MTTEEAVAWLAEQDAEAQWFHEGNEPRCSVYVHGYSVSRDTLAEAVARCIEIEKAGRR